MTRNTRRRRLQRRQRQAKPRSERVVETHVRWPSLYQRFSNLTHRGEPLLQLVYLGIVVEARNPEELAVNMRLALIEITKRQRPC